MIKLLSRKPTALRLVDRKSGSAGMPRPISYAVFCLKKKMVLQFLDCGMNYVLHRADDAYDALAVAQRKSAAVRVAHQQPAGWTRPDLVLSDACVYRAQ